MELYLTHLLTVFLYKASTKSSPFYLSPKFLLHHSTYLLANFPSLVQATITSHHNSFLACNLAVLTSLNCINVNLVLVLIHSLAWNLKNFPVPPEEISTFLISHGPFLTCSLFSFPSANFLCALSLSTLPSFPCILCLSHTQFQFVRFSFHELSMKVNFSGKLFSAFCTVVCWLSILALTNTHNSRIIISCPSLLVDGK